MEDAGGFLYWEGNLDYLKNAELNKKAVECDQSITEYNDNESID